MFPKEMLDCEFLNEENTLEIYIKIKRTSKEIKAKQELLKEREQKYLELQRFVQAKRLTGTLE